MMTYALRVQVQRKYCINKITGITIRILLIDLYVFADNFLQFVLYCNECKTLSLTRYQDHIQVIIY